MIVWAFDLCRNEHVVMDDETREVFRRFPLYEAVAMTDDMRRKIEAEIIREATMKPTDSRLWC